MAGRIPQSFINDLLDRVDIVDVIDGRVQLKKAGKNYSGLCPFHDEKTPSFTVAPDKQFYHCFGCQESGTALTFLMKFERLEFVEAVEALAQQMGVEVPRERGHSRADKVDSSTYDVLGRAEKYFRKELKDSAVAIEYLKGRGLTGEVARDFGVGYAPDAWHGLGEALQDATEAKLLEAGLLTKNEKGNVYDRFRDRIVFPIRDTRGRTIGFGGRTLSAQDGPKYLNSPETPVFHKSQELYGLYEARRALRNLDSLILVEGYMDVVALAQFGVANSVATLGTASGQPHFEKLFRYADEVICCFDGDQAGRQAAWKALDNALGVLNEHRQIKFVFLPDGEDPDSFIRERGKAGFEGFLLNATSGLEFLLAKLAHGLDLKSVDDRAKFVGLTSPYIDKVPPGILQTVLRDRVKDLTGFSAGPAQHVRRRGTLPSNGSKKKTSTLSERLLTYVLKHPPVWTFVPAEVRLAVLDVVPQLDLLGEIVAYIDEFPEADTNELLVRWADETGYDDLLRLAQRPLELDVDALAQEFVEGVIRLLDHLRTERRKLTVEDLKEAPNIDELRKYWRERQGSPDESIPEERTSDEKHS